MGSMVPKICFFGSRINAAIFLVDNFCNCLNSSCAPFGEKKKKLVELISIRPNYIYHIYISYISYIEIIKKKIRWESGFLRGNPLVLTEVRGTNLQLSVVLLC